MRLTFDLINSIIFTFDLIIILFKLFGSIIITRQ